jgi:3-keto-5-aminohexanoate cleavage enzyme
MARKVIITVAQTGAFQGKEVNPNIPIQPDEIAQSAYECYNAGASIVHIHARDKQGVSTNDPKIYSEINSKIRSKCNLILQNSTAPANVLGTVAEDGMKLLYADDVVLPEMCSLDCSLIGTSWAGRTFIYEWTRDFLVRHAKRMQELNIKPELEIFNETTINDVFKYVYPQGVFNDPMSLTFVMGMDKSSQGAMEFSPQVLMYLISKLPKGTLFGTMGIGVHQLPATIMTMLLGGNIRVGMEDNIMYSKGELAKSNAQLVERAARYVREFGFEVATPEEAREILGIK